MRGEENITDFALEYLFCKYSYMNQKTKEIGMKHRWHQHQTTFKCGIMKIIKDKWND